MSDHRYLLRAPTVATAHLQRAGKIWRVPIRDENFWLAPVDDLFLGDKLSIITRIDPCRTLLLRVTFSAGRTFSHERREVAYEMPAVVACPQCSTSSVHLITVADTAQHRGAGRIWTFSRTCENCEHTWLHDGYEPSLTEAVI